MIRPILYKSKIGQEVSTNFANEWFSCVKEGMLHNIDTLCFTAYTVQDYKLLVNLQNYLEFFRNQAESANAEVCLEPYNYFIQPFGISFYSFYLVSKNRYAIFFSKPHLRETDMPILIRLSSEFLWYHGELDALYLCINEVNDFLSAFGTNL